MRRNNINKLGIPVIDMWGDVCREANDQLDYLFGNHIPEQWRKQCPTIVGHVIDQVKETIQG